MDVTNNKSIFESEICLAIELLESFEYEIPMYQIFLSSNEIFDAISSTRLL